MTEDEHFDFTIRTQALGSALNYALGRTHTNPADVIEIADTFYNFLRGDTQND
jgi:hypothetical protein